MNEEQQKEILRLDIKELSNKLLYVTTKEIKEEIAIGEKGERWNVKEKERRKEVRQMKNRLKELIEIFQTIHEAERITGHTINPPMR